MLSVGYGIDYALIASTASSLRDRFPSADMLSTLHASDESLSLRSMAANTRTIGTMSSVTIISEVKGFAYSDSGTMMFCETPKAFWK